jgi:hypothetical protein
MAMKPVDWSTITGASYRLHKPDLPADQRQFVCTQGATRQESDNYIEVFIRRDIAQVDAVRMLRKLAEMIEHEGLLLGGDWYEYDGRFFIEETADERFEKGILYY